MEPRNRPDGEDTERRPDDEGTEPRAGDDTESRPDDEDGGNRSVTVEPSGRLAVESADPERLTRLRRVSHLLDSAVEIPGTNVRIGLDPLLGLLPGVGDATATAASAYVVAEAAALGAPRATIARMCLNLLVDALLGSIPLVGDAFDVVWRANDRNVRLLEARLADPTAERRDRRVVVVLGTAVFVGLLAVSVVVLATLWWLFGVAGVA